MGAKASPAAAAAPALITTASATLAAGVKPSTTPRLRTRLVAARLVLELPAAVGQDPRHFDALAAQKVVLPCRLMHHLP